jgi:hypothetical protein
MNDMIKPEVINPVRRGSIVLSAWSWTPTRIT